MGLTPTWDDTTPVSQPPQQQMQEQSEPSWDNTIDPQEKYGTPGQMALTGVEGVAQGVAGPVATAAEAGLNKLGVPGFKPEDIRGRAEANPITHGLTEAGGFAGSMLTGVGEARVLEGIGQAAVKGADALGLANEAYPVISKIASSGVRTGAEVAALQAGDEISKQINQDPGASLGSAISSVGLAALLGGAGGVAIGSLSPLFSKTVESMGIPKLVDDAKATLNFRQTNPDVPTAVTGELNTRLNEVQNMRYDMGSLKGDALAAAMPERTVESGEKIGKQMGEISSLMQSQIDEASRNAKLKGAVPYLSQDLSDFNKIIDNVDASYTDRFNAANDLKRSLDKYVNYRQDVQSTALGELAGKIANKIRPMLEDSDVWGKAGDVQRDVNKAISKSITAEKEALGKFTIKEMGSLAASQDKVTTLLNQAAKGRGVDKANAIFNYIEHTDNLADTINKIHTDAGLPAPVALTPMAAADHALQKGTPGRTLGNWLFDKGLATLAGQASGEAIGAGLGSIVGHPFFGAMIGGKMLAPALTSIAKPLMESGTNTIGFKAATDYILNVMRGDRLLNNSVERLFKGGAEIIPKHLMPSAESNEKLETALTHSENMDNVANAGGHIGHYLPAHGNAAIMTATAAKQFIASQKPHDKQLNFLDAKIPPSKAEMAHYDRVLSVAQSPLSVLPRIKNGTLLPQDVHTLKMIYPDYYAKMSHKLMQAMGDHVASDGNISYKMRQSISLFLGQPVDSTMTPQSIQAVQAMYASKHVPPPQAQQGGKKKSGNTSKLSKLSDNMQTATQSAEQDRLRS